MNAKELKVEMLRKNVSMTKLAENLRIDRSALWRKMNEKGGKFDRSEIQQISKILNLSADDTVRFFLRTKLSKCNKF